MRDFLSVPLSESCALIISQSSQWIWINLGLLWRLVGLMNFLLIYLIQSIRSSWIWMELGMVLRLVGLMNFLLIYLIQSIRSSWIWYGVETCWSHELPTDLPHPINTFFMDLDGTRYGVETCWSHELPTGLPHPTNIQGRGPYVWDLIQ